MEAKGGETAVKAARQALKAQAAAAPLVAALKSYARDGVVRFHMPGHKGGAGAPPLLLEALGTAVFRWDVTGVEGLDDLHEPAGVIRAAQELAARAFGADRTFFLVNGTSAGVQAMILAACRPGDEIIVPRNVHKSIMAGIILSGAQPVFLMPEVDRRLGIAMGVAPQRVEEALARHPQARAVMLINPTYYGVTTDLRAIAAAVHARGKPLLVDEAHGPHFRFHEALPEPALAAGADACAQGMHKILAGMTQASLLHVRGDRVDPARLKAALQVIHTTSASYILLASLDAARLQIATDGRALLDRALALAGAIRDEVNAIPGLYSFGAEVLGRPGAAGLDPTKVTVTVRDLGLSGQQVEMILRYRYGIQVELSDLYNVLLIVGFGNTEEDARRLVAALREIAADPAPHRTEAVGGLLRRAEDLGMPPIPEPATIPREAFFAPSTPVPLEKAAGRIAAEIVTCYPPGIPIICPGERVTPEIVEYLVIMRAAGFRISGPRDPSLHTLQVL